MNDFLTKLAKAADVDWNEAARQRLRQHLLEEWGAALRRASHADENNLWRPSAKATPPGPLPIDVDPTLYYGSSPLGPGVEGGPPADVVNALAASIKSRTEPPPSTPPDEPAPLPPPAAEPGLLDRILGWPRARWDVLVQAFKQNPVLASALAAVGPTALLGGAYGTYRAARDRNLLRSLLFGALSGAGGGALYQLLSTPVEGLSSLWLPLAIGALIGAGGGAGAYGLGRLLG